MVSKWEGKKDDEPALKPNWRDDAEEQISKMCKEYVSDGKPQKTEVDKAKYDFCCEKRYYCAIWAQAWFWWTIGGVLLLLIIISVLGCVWCCCLRKRGGGGRDEQKEVEEPNENRSDIDSSESSSDSD